MTHWLWLMLTLLATVSGQIPRSPCPQYFSYQPQNGRYIGHIRMPNVGSSVKLKISISSEYQLPSNLLERATGTNDFWLHFPNRRQLPVINWIDINDHRVCKNEAAAPSSYNHRSQYSSSFSSGDSWPRSGSDWDFDWDLSWDWDWVKDEIPSNKSLPFVSRHEERFVPTTPASLEGDLGEQEDGISEINPPPYLSRNGERDVQKKSEVRLYRSDSSSAGCGISEKPPTALVQLGNPTEKGEWPWLATIIQFEKLTFLCAGTLVDLSHVVTAAHCVVKDNGKGTKVRRSPEELFVELGKYNLEAIFELESQSSELRRILIHEGYEPATFKGDIALLELNAPLKYTKFVRPICLWPSDQPLQYLSLKDTWVVGWGRDENGKMVTKMPMKASSKIVSHKMCRKVSSRTGIPLINKNSLCAGFKNGSGPCSGDSGGGLMTADRERDDKGKLVDKYYLTGVVSVGLKNSKEPGAVCNLKKYYTIYTNVNKYLDWLREYVDG